MYSQICSALFRRIIYVALSTFLLAVLSSCSRHSVAPPAQRPVSAVVITSRPVFAVPKSLPPKVLPPISFPDLYTGQISILQFSPDGRRLAFGYGTDAEVALWNMETGKLDWQRYVNAAGGGRIQFGPNGRFLIAQFSDPDDDTPIMVCGLGGQLIRHLPSYQDSGTARLEKQGRFLVVGGSQNKSVGNEMYWHAVHLTEVWDTHRWRKVDQVRTAPTDPDGFVPLTASGKIRNHLTSQRATKLRRAEDRGYMYGMPKRLAASYNSYITLHKEYAAGVTEGGQSQGEVEVWNLRLQRRLWKITLKDDCPRAPAISPDGHLLAVATLGGFVYFWDMKTGRFLSKTHCALDVLRCLAFSPNSQVLAVAGGQGNVSSTVTDGIRLLDCGNYKIFAVMKDASSENQDGLPSKDWTLDHPDWLAALRDLSYIASESVIKKIRTPGKPRNAALIQQFERPQRIRAALRKCYQQ